ncbi:AAA family ATPase [Pseudomonas gessardii]|uniref:AAA family ATPase n=1 Tax=Pseudomonas gessardii TaxID=78544 RepID=A0ABS9FBC9_9PSED|nr:ParA family partition ATPase [Pseudomonas gessardii]MCF4980771.1 AAA family ATPase [Pseudomonas gessardii]MCF4988490.1 AAA family ATPase [Pseudomonas gessardii]MCF5098263.1 AAA family ATPase [Pseudomonas gessardii]MCF5098264.1 AAA family ATPase [Pseudomonas gessardii]MCF5109660.1 AAA family ATPase [Pseudomonas gessardii]
MAKVISILNQKGGTTKTTTSTNLAACLAVKHDKRVLLVDLDGKQGSASDWANSRVGEPGDPSIIPTVVMGKQLARDLPKITAGYDIVIVDGAGQVNELSGGAIKAADLVVIPVQPSQYDIWATGDLVQLVKDRQEITDGKPLAVMLVARAIVGTLMERDARTALEGFGLPILKTQTHQRQSYVNGIIEGRSVSDLPTRDPARKEIEALADEILEILQ